MKKYLILLGIIIVCMLLGGGWYFWKSGAVKGGSGTGMFEKNSESISIYYKDELLVELRGEQREKLVETLQDIDTNKKLEMPENDVYSYKIDCNNDWGIVWLNSEKKTCYLGQEEGGVYAFPEEAYTYIFEKLLVKE